MTFYAGYADDLFDLACLFESNTNLNITCNPAKVDSITKERLTDITSWREDLRNDILTLDATSNTVMIADKETDKYGTWLIKYYEDPGIFLSCAYFKVRNPCDGVPNDSVEYFHTTDTIQGSYTVTYAELVDPIGVWNDGA